MTEPTEAQINKARGIIYVEDVDYVAGLLAERAEHEAAMQRVSEAFCEVVAITERVNGYQSARTVIKSLAAPFILPDPTPTPEQVLAEAIKACGIWDSGETLNTRLVGALAKRGHHVAPIKDTRHD